MLANAFVVKPEQPSDCELATALGPSKGLWDQLIVGLAKEYEIGTHEWNCYSRKAGWALKLKHGDRTIVYLSPSHGCFMASFALGDRAIQAARKSNLPKRVIKIISESKRFAEGTAVRIDVNQAEDIEVVKRLAQAKLEN